MARIRGSPLVLALALGATPSAGAPPALARAESQVAIATKEAIANLGSAAEQATRNPTQTARVGDPAAGTNVEISDLGIDEKITRGDATARGTVTVRMFPCPDAKGIVTGDFTLELAVGNDLVKHTTVHAVGYVSDSASLTGLDLSARGTAEGAGLWGTASNPTRWTSGTGTPGEPKVTPNGIATEADGRDLARDELAQAHRLINPAFRQAEQLWRGGYCVEIRVLAGGSRQVKPNEKVKIAAASYQRQEGKRLKDKVSARMLFGKKDVTPKQPQPPVARFTYSAPAKPGEDGAVGLRSVSRRGIGTTRLQYHTQGDLRVDAVVAFASITGVKCDSPLGTWHLHADVHVPSGDYNGDFTVTLEDDNHGIFEIDAQLGKGSVTGSGPATYDEGSKVLVLEPTTFTLRVNLPPISVTTPLPFSGGSVTAKAGTFCTNGQPNP